MNDWGRIVADCSRVVEFEGLRLAYSISGDGLPLILLHSGLSDRQMWDDHIASLNSDHRVVRYDLRGFGESTYPPGSFAHHDDLRALMDPLEIDRATLIGVSMGGQVALQMALSYPERVSGLVLSTTLAGAATSTEAVERIWRESDAAFLAGDIAGAVEIELRGWVDGPHRSPSHVDPGVRARVQAMNSAIWARRVGESDAGPEEDFEPAVPSRLGEIAVPTLLIVGDLDQAMVIESMESLKRGIARAESVMIEGTAHFPNLERPELFNTIVRDFLRRHAL